MQVIRKFTYDRQLSRCSSALISYNEIIYGESGQLRNAETINKKYKT